MIALWSTTAPDRRKVRPIRELRLLLCALLVAAAAAPAGCGGDRPSQSAPPSTTVESDAGLRAVELARGLDRPVHAAAAPGEPGRLYVAGQGGVIQVVDDGRIRPEPFLDLGNLVTTGPKGEPAAEQGLLSLAFAPDYATSGRFYVDYTDRDGDVRVVEYRARDGVADPASARTLLHVEKQRPIHNGGQLQIGPDGQLHVGIGDDGASQVSPQSLAPGDLLGKIVRVGDGGPEVVAYGLRNPWRFSFDRETGDLWIGDVGELGWEEVSVVARGTAEPANLGWDAYEGFEEVVWDEGGRNEPRGPGELVWPAAVYARGEGCAAVIGGYVYRGERLSALRGRYVYGDFCTGAVWSLDPDEPGLVRLELELGTTLASFAEDGAGELYLVSRTGTVFELRD
ncbi:MAG TPA: PQQ-dependent sugar dehydrogenase [Gaiellaceae bacterium]|nr:PQQ-dependent sugar dehydrogenase [Gaiellaceae bacterium]